jgi:hypothetical protein
MSNVINSEDIKVKVSGKFGSLFSKTNITIGVTDKFVYKEVSQGKNSGTKIYPQTRIDSYGIEVFQIAKWFLYAIIFLVVLPIAILLNDSYDWIIIELERNYLLITSIVIIWLQSRKLTFEINTISKEKLQIELKSTNTKDVEEFMKFLNKSIQ